MATQEDIRQSITSQIVDSLKSGDVPPWRRPWGISAQQWLSFQCGQWKAGLFGSERAAAQNGGNDAWVHLQALGDLPPVDH